MVGAFLVQYLQFCAVALCRNGFRATSMHDILIELRLSAGSVWHYLPGSVGDSPSSVNESMAAMADSAGGFMRQGRGASLTGIVVAAIKARRTLHARGRRTGGAVARVRTEMLEMCFETGGPPDGVPVFLVMAGHAPRGWANSLRHSRGSAFQARVGQLKR